jgi:two-component system cell cycle response regulator
LSDGYHVRAVANGLEALQALRDEPFDCVLLDVLMRRMDGYRALEHIRSNAKLRRTPVIMISGLADAESVGSCIELGAEDYLPKPFDPVPFRPGQDQCGAHQETPRRPPAGISGAIGHVVAAAAAVEAEKPSKEGSWTASPAGTTRSSNWRVFQQMATEVRARERRLKQQVLRARFAPLGLVDRILPPCRLLDGLVPDEL